MRQRSASPLWRVLKLRLGFQGGVQENVGNFLSSAYNTMCQAVKSLTNGVFMCGVPFLLPDVVPLLRESIGILMQRTPPSLDHALPECYQRVQQLQGVYNLQEPHFWTLCTDVYIGTLKLLVAPDADSRWILSQTHNIFTQVGTVGKMNCSCLMPHVIPNP
ncbi:Zinc transporter 7 [Labeo rohita]|uniref:Zinc transporter n=1 Tax=Labeo rohita TaxID=84645 RepID=A0ABQ8LIN8_LABRO|nr:Zinc transporter 7 [Labeo rohita]